MNRTNIYLSDEQKARLEEDSKERGISAAEIVRKALDHWFALEDGSKLLKALEKRMFASPNEKLFLGTRRSDLPQLEERHLEAWQRESRLDTYEEYKPLLWLKLLEEERDLLQQMERRNEELQKMLGVDPQSPEDSGENSPKLKKSPEKK